MLNACLALVFTLHCCRLHASGQRWVPIIDCGIPVAQDDAAYQEGIAAGVFIKDMSGKPYIGQVGDAIMV
jgi:alpha-glucosidase (family GH31 glycosyl hydrolase)